MTLSRVKYDRAHRTFSFVSGFHRQPKHGYIRTTCLRRVTRLDYREQLVFFFSFLRIDLTLPIMGTELHAHPTSRGLIMRFSPT